MKSSVSDVDLMERVALNQDKEAFSELYQRYYSKAYDLCWVILRNSEGSLEAVQEGFLRIWLSAHTYQPMKGI